MANSTTNVDTVIASQASKEVTINAALDAASQAMTYGRRASTSSGLTWGYYGGNVVITDGTMSQIANGTLTLTASNTNYIVAAKATGAVTGSTENTNWLNQTDYWRLYSVVAGAATVTSYTDSRDFMQRPAVGLTMPSDGKTTPVDADYAVIADTEAGTALKRLTWSNIKATLKTYFDGLYQAASATLSTWAGITPGTGVADALKIAVGSAGSFLTNGGALGTPSGGTLTNCTGLPAAGVVDTAVTLTATQELTNKTLNAAVAKGTWTASGTWTLPAFTLGGEITGNSQNISGLGAVAATSFAGALNGTVGATTPAVGSFTTLTLSGNATLGTSSNSHTLPGLLKSSAANVATKSQLGIFDSSVGGTDIATGFANSYFAYSNGGVTADVSYTSRGTGYVGHATNIVSMVDSTFTIGSNTYTVLRSGGGFTWVTPNPAGESATGTLTGLKYTTTKFRVDASGNLLPGADNAYNLGSTGTRWKTGYFGDINASGNVTLGDASTDTLNVGNGGIIKDASGNVGIGEAEPDYKLDVNGTFGFTPGASVTPVDNGDVVFELTNNTTLTIKAKGSDGTVRSVALTLA